MKRLALSVFVICVCATTSLVQAQATPMVDVDGHRMRVRTSRVGSAIPGPPVVVFEAGNGGGLEVWRSVFAGVADFAAVVAYDRAGMRGSESDGELPTPRHVAENLHALLDRLGAEPPYVLVGHSLGGPFIRMFTGMYPEHVGGLVYVDPTAILTEEDLRAYNEARGFDEDEARVRKENLRQRLADPQLSPWTRVSQELRHSNFAEFHSLPPVPDVPVSVLISGRFDARRFPPLPDSSAIKFYCEPRECHARLTCPQ